MAGAGKKWAIGCGCGCLVIVVVMVAVGYGGYLMVQRAVEQAEEIGRAVDDVRERFGEVRDYCPEPSGAIAADRVEAFLAVREAMAERRAELESTLSTLASGEQGEIAGPADVLAMIKAGTSIIPAIMGFLSNQAEAMLAQEMGPGEYAYIYSLSYYSWLGKDPGDGPPFQLQGDGVHSGTANEERVRRERDERLRRGVNRTFRVMVANQLEAARAQAVEADPWLEQLEAEIGALTADPERLPWADGLPAPLASSLEPYRDRLEASYSPLCNPLEIELGLHR